MLCEVYIKYFMDLSTLSFLKRLHIGNGWFSVLEAPIPLTIFLYQKQPFQYFLVTHSQQQHPDKDWSDSLTIILAPTFMGGTLFFSSSIHFSTL